jgi:Flp pilus assembly pilin Flp
MKLACRDGRRRVAASKARSLSRWRRLRDLWRNQHGTTAIEFAFVAGPVIYLMIAIIEFCISMTVANSLEAATNMSSRLGKTGYVDEELALTQEETIMDEVERRVGPLIDMNKVDITSQSYNDFDSLTNPDILDDKNGDGDFDDLNEWTDMDHDGYKDGAPGLGETGAVVVYKITYPWKLLTPLLDTFVGDNGVLSLSAYSVVKNEPY